MRSFLKFIEEDITAKKTLVTTTPTKTKRDKKKYNEKISEIEEKYLEYKTRVKKYLDTKSKSFDIKKDTTSIITLKTKVTDLERVRFLLNPDNTFFEKMGFDTLLYEISHYYDFNFEMLNNTLNSFIDKFELVVINLTGEDFDYTTYVNEYMTAFLEVRKTKSDSYEKVSQVFEKIYWLNPELIQHIELNFRKLIKKHKNKFVNYISKIQKEVMSENGVSSFDDCLDKLRKAYNELTKANKEDITDIIEMSKNGEIDINNYFEDSKVRTTTYSSLMIDAVDLTNKDEVKDFYDALEKLRINIEEYSSYLKFLPLIKDFKKEYEKQVDKTDSLEEVAKSVKALEIQIAMNEDKLDKNNKALSGNKTSILSFMNKKDPKTLKMEAVNLAKDLYVLYQKYDHEVFKQEVIKNLNKGMTVTEFLRLYYSFDYFKKEAIKKVFELATYDDTIKESEEFDLFAMNPNNMITKGLTVFGESNISRVIVNKYRLDNIEITEETLNADELPGLLEKIELVLRNREIAESGTNVEKIWFQVQVKKINDKEKGNKKK